MKIQKNKKVSKLKLILLIAIPLVVLGGAAAWYFVSQKDTAPTTTERPVNDVDYSGPSKEDIESSQDAKKRGETNKEQQKPSPEDPSKRAANLGIAFADKEGDFFEVRAFVTNVIEGNGVCTAILKNGNKVISRESKAFIDASSSQCMPITIPISELTPSGVWSLVVTYKSPTSKGTTEPEAVNI